MQVPPQVQAVMSLGHYILKATSEKGTLISIDLPFEDNYAEIITSRGSFQFWKNKQLAFSEIYRVLKPGGVAFIGRGFSENLSIETARKIRQNGNDHCSHGCDSKKGNTPVRSVLAQQGHTITLDHALLFK